MKQLWRDNKKIKEKWYAFIKKLNYKIINNKKIVLVRIFYLILFFIYYINVKELIKKPIKVYKLKSNIYNYSIRKVIDG